MSTTKKKKEDCKKLNLALQGGGAHGAFTWGVLDEFLRQGNLDFEGISATSAGSMNAVIMTQGLITGGVEGAREALEQFWRTISDVGSVFTPVSLNSPQVPNFFSPFLSPVPNFLTNWQKEWSKNFENGWRDGRNQASQFVNLLSQNISPYQFNPFNYNPLRTILEDMVDFEKIRATKEVQLFITATNVQTGDDKIFRTPELTCDMVLASCALPTIFQAVEVDGQYYWDGGYVGNPSLWPLFYEVSADDVLIVHVNPLIREEIPKNAPAIENRLNEITFNSALLKELRAISFVQKLLQENMLKEQFRSRYRDVLVHAIRAEESMSALDLSSKYDTSWDFLLSLRDQGRAQAKHWLKAHFKDIGQTSTINIARDYFLPIDTEHHKKSR
ncbi:MAG: patatin-like phospholipase family protein [Alphaproteobacteria bacterium]|nr:patatin-like phospholipase family protein [Alphaproteobacteria bacterium]